MTKLRPGGGYRTTCSFQTATIIYDATHWFCETCLLDQQIAALEQAFIQDGGYSEQLAIARLAQRQKRNETHIPPCPQCGQPTVLRTAKTGKNAGQQFWGCSQYPNCRGVVKV